MNSAGSHKDLPQDLPEARANMPVTVGHRIQLILARGLFFFSRLIGIDAASWIGGMLMRMVGPMIGKVHRRGYQHLTHIYAQMDESEKQQVLKRVWENLGRVGGEFAHLDRFLPWWDDEDLDLRLDQLVTSGVISQEERDPLRGYRPAAKGRVEVNVSDDFLIAIAKRQPVIFVTGHFANWEVMPAVCDFFDIPCAIVYRAANNALIDDLIIRIRAQFKNHRQIPKGPEGARAFIDALKDRYSLGLLVDQKFTDGVQLPFLGQPALTVIAPARMALNYDLPVIPVSVKRLKGAQFVMRVHNRIDVERSGNLQDDAAALMIQVNHVLGEEIENDPGQWLWFHRRWGKLLEDI